MPKRYSVEVDFGAQADRAIAQFSQKLRKALDLRKVDLGLDNLAQEARTAEQEVARLGREIDQVEQFDGRAVARGVNEIGTAADGATTGVNKFGGSIKSAAAAAAALIGTREVLQFFAESATAASDAAESVNAVSVTFGEAAGSIEQFAATSAGIGFSATAAREASVQFGSLFNAFNVGADEGAELSNTFVALSSDLASVYNADTADAAAALAGLFRGEAEPARQFGIAVSAASVQQEALRLGLAKTKAEIGEYEKVLATASLVQQQTANVAGDFANTLGGSLPNQLRVLSAEFSNFQVELGQQFQDPLLDAVKTLRAEALPALQDALTGIDFGQIAGDAIPPLIDLATTIIELVPIIAEVAGTFGGAFSTIAGVALDVADAFGPVGDSILGVAGAAGAAALAFGPLGAAIVGVVAFAEAMDTLFETDLDRSLRTVDGATRAYTESLLAQQPANAATEASIQPLIDRYNELALAAAGADDAVTGTVEDSTIADFYRELDDATREALDRLIEYSGGQQVFQDGLEAGTDASILLGGAVGRITDEFGLGSAAAILAAEAVDGLRDAQAQLTANTEADARSRFDNIAGLTAYEGRVREIGRALTEAGSSSTPFTDAQDIVNQQMIDLQLVAGGYVGALGEVSAELIEVGNASSAFGNDFASALDAVNGQALTVQFDEAAYLERVAVLTPQVSALFGRPFTPRIEEEDFNAYLDRVAEVQAAVTNAQLNLLKIEAATEDETFAAFLDLIEPLGEEAAAVFTKEFADTVGTDAFDQFEVDILGNVESAQIKAKLDAAIAAAGASELPVSIELDDTELLTLGNQTFGAEVVASVDATALEQLLEDEYGIDVELVAGPLDIPAIPTQFIDLEVSATYTDDLLAALVNPDGSINVSIALNGATGLDKGGAILDPTLAWIAEAGNPEAVIGPHHRPSDAIGWLDQVGALAGIRDEILSAYVPTIQPMQESAVFDAPRYVYDVHVANDTAVASELAGLRDQVSTLSQQLADVATSTAAVAATTGRHLPNIDGATDQTATATVKIATAKPSKVSARGRGRTVGS